MVLLRRIADNYYDDLVDVLDEQTKIHCGRMQDLALTQSYEREKWKQHFVHMDKADFDRIKQVMNYDHTAKRREMACLV